MTTREEHQEQIKHMDNKFLLNYYENLCWSIGVFDATRGEHSSQKETFAKDAHWEILRRMEGK